MYKILITNYGLLILVFFSILIGYNELNHNYIPSVYENYYQSIMLKLEGKQTNEKINDTKLEKT